jgi:hypothetical protein
MKALFQSFKMSKPEKITFYITTAVVVLASILTCFYWYKGLENVIGWDVLSELDEIPTILDTFSDGKFNFTINGNAYLVSERYLATPLKINTLASIFYFGFILIGLNLLLATFSTLNRTWFFIGIAALAAILTFMGLENLFAQTDKTAFLITFGFYGGLMVAFNSFFNKFSLFKRFIAFLILTLGLLFTANFFVKVQHPILSFTNYGLLVFVAISLVFIFFISHEAFGGIVNIISKSARKDESSLGQFLIVSTIYFANVLLIYLEKAKYIDWSLFTISPFLLYFVSMALGFLGFAQYQIQSNALQTTRPKDTSYSFISISLYIGLAIIATATIGYAFATANDPLIEVFEDFIAISHLCMGLVFLFYVLINFIQMLRRGMQIQKILYKPPFYPISLFRIAALVGVFVLVSFKNNYSLYQVQSAYQNSIGDFYMAEGDAKTAEAFYKEGRAFDVRNHRSSYSLASLAMQANDNTSAGFYLRNALMKNPSPFAYSALATILKQEDRFFDAFFQMQAGIKSFPENAELLTNMAYFQGKVKQNDSTKIYLDLAKKHCSNCEVEETNLQTFDAKFNKGFDKIDQSAPLKLNKDSILNVRQFASIYNNSVNKSPQPQRGVLLSKIILKNDNQPFFEDLTFAKACQNYYKEDKLLGIKQLAVLASDSTKHQMLYRRAVGMWFLQNGVYDKAIEYLAKSGDKESVELLQINNYEAAIPTIQAQQAADLLKKGNLESALKASPLNPILIEKQIELLNKNNKVSEGYKLAFDAVDVNPNSVSLLKIKTLQALKLGVTEYAEDGLNKLKDLMKPTDYQQFVEIYKSRIPRSEF